MSNPMSLSQARVVDPILTQRARGYRMPGLVHHRILTITQVEAQGGQIIEFGAEDFLDYGEQIVRAPGGDILEVQFGYAGKPYALIERSLAGKVPVERLLDARRVPNINLAMLNVRKALNITQLGVERAAAALLTADATYPAAHVFTLAGASQWSHANSTPAKYIEEKKELIAEGIAMEPNTLLVGQQVHRALKNNADVIDRIKHTEGLTGSSNPTVTEAKLAQYFDVDHYVVGRARTGEPGAFKPLWGKIAILAYTEVGSLAEQGTPSFGYTYRLRGYPMVEPGYYRKRNASWIYPVHNQDTPVVAGKDAGVLIKEAVA